MPVINEERSPCLPEALRWAREADITVDDLDEMVHDYKQGEAVFLYEMGVEYQLDYLLELQDDCLEDVKKLISERLGRES